MADEKVMDGLMVRSKVQVGCSSARRSRSDGSGVGGRMRLPERGWRIRGVTVVPRIGLRRQLLLAKALPEEWCAVESMEMAVGMRVQGKECVGMVRCCCY